MAMRDHVLMNGADLLRKNPGWAAAFLVAVLMAGCRAPTRPAPTDSAFFSAHKNPWQLLKRLGSESGCAWRPKQGRPPPRKHTYPMSGKSQLSSSEVIAESSCTSDETDNFMRALRAELEKNARE